MNKQREEFENRFPDITYLELKDDKYVPRTNMTKYGDAVWAIAERQNCRFEGWQAAQAARQPEIDALKLEIAALRTGDTCGRQCEGTAYRIEAGKLKRDNEQLKIDNTDLKANLVESNIWLAKANVRIAESQKRYALWLIYFDDAGRKPEMYTSEEAALHRYEVISVSWNAHLFALVNSNSSDAEQYPPIPPEVAELKARIVELEAQLLKEK